MVRAEKPGSVYTYTYNGDGLLVSETVDGVETVFTWDLALGVPQVLATSDGTKNLYGLERIGVEQAGAWRYTLADALGSVRQWTDPAGAVLGVQSYGPFGEPRDPVGTPPWGFTGEWQDPAGMVYLRARWYNPALGRFLRVDPFPGTLEAPATRHPYAYALNDPLWYADPSGMFTKQELMAWGIAESVYDWWLAHDTDWWSIVDAAQLGDQMTAATLGSDGSHLFPPKPFCGTFALSGDGKQLTVGGLDLMWAWTLTRDRNLLRWNAGCEAWNPVPRKMEFIGSADASEPDTFIAAAPPPVEYEFYFDPNAVEWEEVGMDVTAIGTAGIMRWGKASRALSIAAEALNVGVSDTQLALHATRGEWVAASVDVAGLYPPFAIPAGIVGLAMDLWPGVKVRAR